MPEHSDDTVGLFRRASASVKFQTNTEVMKKKRKVIELSRRQLLGGAAATAVIPARAGFSVLSKKPKVILELTRDAATNSMRAVEKLIWVAR